MLKNILSLDYWRFRYKPLAKSKHFICTDISESTKYLGIILNKYIVKISPYSSQISRELKQFIRKTKNNDFVISRGMMLNGQVWFKDSNFVSDTRVNKFKFLALIYNRIFEDTSKNSSIQNSL